MLKTPHEKENQRKSCLRAPRKSAERVENYSRKISRAPLGGIQNVAAFNHYLSVPGQYVKLQRSKSTSNADANKSFAPESRRKLQFSPTSLKLQHGASSQISQPHATQPPIKEPPKLAPSRGTTIRSKSVSTYTDQHKLASSNTQPPRYPVQEAKHIERYTQNVKNQLDCGFVDRRCYKSGSPQIEQQHLRTRSTLSTRWTKAPEIQILGGNKTLESNQENKTQSHLQSVTHNICRGNGNGENFTKRSEVQILAGNKISDSYLKNQSTHRNICEGNSKNRSEYRTSKLSNQNISSTRRQLDINHASTSASRTSNFCQNDTNSLKMTVGNRTANKSINLNSTNSSVTSETLSLSKKQFIDYIFKENNVKISNGTENNVNVSEWRNQQGSNSTTNFNNYISTNGSEKCTISTTISQNVNDTKEYHQIGDSISPHIERCVQNKQVAHIRGPLVAVSDAKFVDGQIFFLEEPKIVTQTSSISPTDFKIPVRKNSISEKNSVCVRQPGVKSSLKRRSSFRHLDKKLLYAWEYVEDIIRYLKTIESDLLVCTVAVEQLVHKSSRTAYVNWLMQVSEVRTPNNDPVFFMALRIFDWSIVNLKIRENNYRLVTVISYWIATKYLTNAEIKVPKIFSTCNGKYTKMEILAMETLILKKLEFNLKMADPLDFLNYFLKSLNFEKDQHLEYSSQFIIECSALYENHMVTKPSFLAAAALCLAYRVLCQTSEINHKFVGYNPGALQNYADKVLTVNVQYTILKRYSPISKYATPQKLNVVQYFINI